MNLHYNYFLNIGKQSCDKFRSPDIAVIMFKNFICDEMDAGCHAVV